MDSISRHLLCLDNPDMPILDLAHCHWWPLYLNLSFGPERLYLSICGWMFCAPGLFDEMKRNSPLSAFINPTCLGKEVPTMPGPRGGVVTQRISLLLLCSLPEMLAQISPHSSYPHTYTTGFGVCVKSVENTTCHLLKLMRVSWPTVILFTLTGRSFSCSTEEVWVLNRALVSWHKENQASTQADVLPKILQEIQEPLSMTNFRNENAVIAKKAFGEMCQC